MRGILFGFLVAAFAGFVWAADTRNWLHPMDGTAPVAVQGGDTVTIYYANVSSTTVSTIRAASTDRSVRRRILCNQGSAEVSVLSSTTTTLGSDYFTLGESTATGLGKPPCIDVSGSYAINAHLGSNLKGTSRVVLIEETQSLP